MAGLELGVCVAGRRACRGDLGDGQAPTPARIGEYVMRQEMTRPLSIRRSSIAYGFLWTMVGEAWAVGITSISLMLTCGGRVAQ